MAESFQWKKTCANFAVLWLYAKVFSVKFWGVASFGTAKASNPRKFSLRKFTNSQKFSPSKVSRYMVIISLDTIVTLEAPKGTMLFDIGLVRTLSQTLTGCEAKFSVGYIVFTPYSFKDASLTSEDYL